MEEGCYTMESSAIHTFCVAHVPLQIELPPAVHLVWLGSSEPPEGLDCQLIHNAVFAPDLNAQHKYYAGATGSFAIRRFLQENPELWKLGDRISITMYRKFVATLPMGKPAQNYHGSYILYPQQALVIDLDLVHSLVEGDYLLAQIVGLGGVLDQYAKNHYVEDFLRYCAIAVELGVLDRNEVVIFFTQNMLIPGGAEFGVLPIPVFIDIVGRLESICKAFVDMHRPVSDEPYQSRALAFCNERLGSYLLMKRLTTDFRCDVTALPSNFFGFMHTVVKPGAVGV